MTIRGGLKIDMRPRISFPTPRSIAKFAAKGAARGARLSLLVGRMVLNEGIAIAKEVKERRGKNKIEKALRKKAKIKGELVELKERLERMDGDRPAAVGITQDARGWYDECGRPRGWTTGTAAVHVFDAKNQKP